MGPHSSSDDPKRYQPPELFESWQRRDPLDRFRAWLEARGTWTQDWEDGLREELTAAIAKAVETAEATPAPDIETVFTDVYAEMPRLLREQRDALQEQIRRGGAIEDSGGAFPL
jgi:TPP-dependent pyruvate/acetoin dehydrogenase alpha subunit